MASRFRYPKEAEMDAVQSPDAEAALAFARGIIQMYGEPMRFRVRVYPEVIPGGTDEVQMTLVSETGSRWNVTVTYAGNEWGA
jgi:hypothetical protein